MNWLPYGPNAWLFQFAERLGEEAFARGCAIAADLERHPPPGLVEYVPAFTTILLEFEPHEMRPAEELLPELVRRFEQAATTRIEPAAAREMRVS